jgi:hypothetical protein
MRTRDNGNCRLVMNIALVASSTLAFTGAEACTRIVYLGNNNDICTRLKNRQFSGWLGLMCETKAAPGATRMGSP